MTDLRPAISIVIPTYNQAHFLREAIQSVLAQSFGNWEAIIVNNFSEDDTTEVVQSVKDDRIRLIHFRNQGIIGAARNHGVQHANADLIAFLDSDDSWHPDKLKRVMSLFEDQAGIDLVCHDECLLNENGNRSILTYGPHTRYADMLFRGNCLSTSATVLRRRNFLEVGGFSENPRFVGVEDYDLWLRLAKAGCRFFYQHEVLGTYRVHSECFTSKSERHCQHILNVLNSHFAEWQRKTLYFRLLFRRRRAITMRGAAHTFIKQGEHKNAGRFLAMSLREDPLSWKTWLLSIVNLTRARI
jgi:glycosyltransferase involved in cell wall biosynthesis